MSEIPEGVNPVPEQIKKVLAALAEKEKFKTLPKCERCGSQLRDKDDECYCKRFFQEVKE